MLRAETIDLIYKDDDLLAFYKPGGLPTVPLKNGEGDTLLSLVSSSFPEVLLAVGRNPWEGTILHRLDTPTSGLVLAARNERAYRKLIALQDEDKISKTYSAKVSEKRKELPGFEPFPYAFSRSGRVEIVSSFRPFGPKGASVRPILLKRKGDERLYSTIVEIDDDVFHCTITRGFRHQIRAHLSWMNRPIVGDGRYGGEEDTALWLEAERIEFPSLSGKGRTIISLY